MKYFLYILLIDLSFIDCHGEWDTLGDGYIYDRHYKYISVKAQPGVWTGVIPGEIKRYGVDDAYITALQMPDSLCLYEWDTKPSSSLVIYKSDYPTRRRLMQTGPCYWVIDKKANVVYGPMRRKAYRRLCDSLRIDVPLQYK